MRSKLSEWLKRYLPADLTAVCGALIAGFIAQHMFDTHIITALVSTWGDNIGYYSRILFVDVRKRMRRDGSITGIGMWKILRNLIVEFGPAEYLDSFIIRPFITYIFITRIESILIAILVGKVVADITFYVPTIFAYELRKKYLRD